MNMIYKEQLSFGFFETHSSQPKYPNLHHVQQVHGTNIVKLPNTKNTSEIQGDGLYYDLGTKTYKLAILTADCMPVVILGKQGHAFIHAGWQGLSRGIFKTKEIQEIKPYFFFIGPHIQQRSYEVKADFKKNFPHSRNFMDIQGKLHFSLKGEAIDQIHKIYPLSFVESSNICTYEDKHFHSYRRDKTEKRNWNIFMT